MAAPSPLTLPLTDIFASLPYEIILNIIKLAPDLSSLWSLIHASPVCSVLFDICASEIVNTIVIATVPATIQRLMQGTLRCQTLADFTLKEARAVVSDGRIREVPYRLPQKTESKALRKLLSFAHKIHLLSYTCLDHYIDISLTLRPKKLVELPIDGQPGHYREVYERATYMDYQPRKTGPPSWVEEHRVIKAFWIVYHFLQLKKAYRENRLDWPTDDLELLASTDLLDFYELSMHTKQQLLTVYDFIIAKWPDFMADDSIHNPDTPTAAKMENTFNLGCRPKTIYGPKEDHFQQNQEYLNRLPMSLIFHTYMSNNSKYSPLPDVPFTPYRKYGFAIFDDQRMTDLGLAEADRKAWANHHPHFFAWFSILSEEEKQLRR